MIARTLPPSRAKLANLRQWREAADLEQEKLASLAGVSLHTLTRLEAGEPCPHRLLDRLADTLGVVPDDLTDPARAPTAPHTYPKRLRVFVGVGHTGRPVTLFWADYAFLYTWAPERPYGFTYEEIAARSGLTVEIVEGICEGVYPATHRQLTQIAHAVGCDLLALCTTD